MSNQIRNKLRTCSLLLNRSHHELNNQQLVNTDPDVLVGSGIGHLCAAAIACATSIVDLPNVAVEAVRLAFRIGSVVETYSVQDQHQNNRSDSWSLIVSSTLQKAQEELQTVQDTAVSCPRSRDSKDTNLNRPYL
jgi:hypothetical protein